MYLRTNFFISLLGGLGSLYFSEVMHFPPCALCWYQRIFLYPLVFIFGAALWAEDKSFRIYAFPLAFLGLLIAIYHNLLYFGFITEALSPCTQGLSCSSKQLQLFGFVTIPLLSMLGFLMINILLILGSKAFRKELK